MGVVRASKRRSAKRLSLARSLDDLEVDTEFVPFSLVFLTDFCVSRSAGLLYSDCVSLMRTFR